MQASDEELMAAGCKPAPSDPAIVVPSPSEQLSPTEPAFTEPSQSPTEAPKLEAWVEAISLSDEWINPFMLYNYFSQNPLWEETDTTPQAGEHDVGDDAGNLMTWVWKACYGFSPIHLRSNVFQLRPKVNKKPAVLVAAQSKPSKPKRKMTRKDSYISLFMHVSSPMLPLCRNTSEKLPKLGCDEWWRIILPRLGWTFLTGSRNSIKRRTKLRWHKCSWMRTGLRTGRLSIVGVPFVYRDRLYIISKRIQTYIAFYNIFEISVGLYSDTALPAEEAFIQQLEVVVRKKNVKKVWVDEQWCTEKEMREELNWSSFLGIHWLYIPLGRVGYIFIGSGRIYIYIQFNYPQHSPALTYTDHAAKD